LEEALQLFIPANLLKKLTEAIKEQFVFADDPEIGIELDPRALTDEHYSLFEEGFFNRFSIGIQDFDEKVQRAVHRVQSEELTFSTFKKLKKFGSKVNKCRSNLWSTTSNKREFQIYH